MSQQSPKSERLPTGSVASSRIQHQPISSTNEKRKLIGMFPRHAHTRTIPTIIHNNIINNNYDNRHDHMTSVEVHEMHD